MKKRNKKNNYELGSYVQAGNAIGAGANILGGITGDAGLSGLGSGVAAGASFGPPGMIVGGVLGLAGGLIGQNAKRKAERRAKQAQAKQFETDYFNQLDSNLDTNNENPYGIIPEFELGGDIDPKQKKPIYTNNPKDPRIKKYGDSLNLYNKGITDKKNYLSLVDRLNLDASRMIEESNIWSTDKIKPSKLGYLNKTGGGSDKERFGDVFYDTYNTATNKNGIIPRNTEVSKKLRKGYDLYKKPTTPVIYKKSQTLVDDIQSIPSDLEWHDGKELVPSPEDRYGYGLFSQILPNGAKTQKTMSKEELEFIRKEFNAPNLYKSGTIGQAYGSDTGAQIDAALKEYRTKNNKMANGGEVIPSIINIEKGELQIDPNSGKILREYTGMNPETGGLYQPHAKKGKDTNNNFVSAEEGSFIITKKEAKNYKNAVDTNDKLHQNSILQNIRNHKNKQNNKFADGSDVPPLLARQNPYTFSGLGAIGMASEGQFPGYLAPSVGGTINPGFTNATIKPVNYGNGITKTSSNNQSSFNLGTAGDFLANYGPSLINMGRGLFGKTEVTPNVSPNLNPYRRQILNNMSQDISLEPVRQQLLRQQRTAFNQIDNSTSGSPIARANKQNVIANTQTQLGRLTMDQQFQNNQVRGQRASLYNNLGMQDVSALDRAQQINLGIDDINAKNRAARDNMFTTGLGQLQQTYLNNRTNKQRADMQQYELDLLNQIFPAISPYLNRKRG